MATAVVLQQELLGNCRGCGKVIRWVETAASGDMQPLDPEPVSGGNIVLDEQGVAHQFAPRRGVLPLFEDARPRYQAHFASCTAKGLVEGQAQRALRRTRAHVEREIQSIDQAKAGPEDLEAIKRFVQRNARLRTGARWR